MQIDIDQLMQGGLGQWLAEQSDMRAAAKAKAASRWTWSTVLLLPALAFLWFGPDWDTDTRAILSSFGIGGAGIWGYQPIARAKTAIKQGINAAIARSLGIEYALDAQPGPEFEAALTYGLVPSHDRKTCEDRWFGTLEGHGFSLYEAHLQERRGSGKNRRWVTVFRGALIEMEFGRAFHSTTLLQRAGKHKTWFGLGAARDTVTFGGHRLDFVDQVHPEFADVFDLYSDDQVEARVLVHPSYIEHLLALEAAFKGESVRALFRRGTVIIAVKSGELFESGAIDASEDHERARSAAEQFSAMARLALAINQTERGAVRADILPGAPA